MYSRLKLNIILKNDAIAIKNKIDLNKINKLIKDVQCISEIQKNFLITIIKKRYETLFFE